MNRFEIMDLGDDIEEAYLRKLQKEAAEAEELRRQRVETIEKQHIAHKIQLENKGVCEFCGGLMPRWVDNCYVCYDCFIDNLENEASVMAPIHRVEDMRDYITEAEWEELWDYETRPFIGLEGEPYW